MSIEMLKQAPFNLDTDALGWVETTFNAMSTDQKVSQLFVLMASSGTQEALDAVIAFQPGGLTKVYGTDAEADLDWLRAFCAQSAIPPMINADLEGSRMGVAFGTKVPNPLGLAAIDDPDATRAATGILAREGRAAGITCSFTPVIDINHSFRSAIVGTRSFGSDIATIERHALAQIETFQQNGVAATVKHWPGEGFDDRDQHLVTTINPLSMDEWEQSFGRLYRTAIDAGVKAVMAGHIALPAFMRELDPDCGIDAFRPASINKALTVTLLRERLGFNGIVISDATSMAGLGAWCGADEAIPALIANGCDVILFSNNPARDRANVRKAVDDGSIGMDRLDEAVLRILGLKAAQGLHRTPVIADKAETATAFRQPEDLAIAEKIISRVPTLVKDTQNLFPLDPEKHKRVLVFTNDVVIPVRPGPPLPFALPQMLEAEGFEVTRFEPGVEVTPEKFDLVLYLFGEESLLTRNHLFIDWLGLTGFFGTAMQRYWHDIPTAMISFGHPYYLYDAPRVPAYVNAYSTLDEMQRAVLECMMGRAAWNRNSPVDPFCGLEDARY